MKKQKIAFVDIEGVLMPEFWPYIAEKFNISSLKLTTRETSDYESLVNFRIQELNKNKITITNLQDSIKELEPLEGAISFLEKLKKNLR